jgi:hypothetical protein
MIRATSGFFFQSELFKLSAAIVKRISSQGRNTTINTTSTALNSKANILLVTLEKKKAYNRTESKISTITKSILLQFLKTLFHRSPSYALKIETATQPTIEFFRSSLTTHSKIENDCLLPRNEHPICHWHLLLSLWDLLRAKWFKRL